MSAVAVGLFVIACGWNVYRLFTPTRAAALRAEGHPQYFGAFLAAGYVAFLAVFLHAAAISVPVYATAISELVRLVPLEKDEKPETVADKKPPAIERTTTWRNREARQVLIIPIVEKSVGNNKLAADPYPVVLGIGIWSAILATFLPFFLNLPFKLNRRANLLAGLKIANEVEQQLVDALTAGTSVMITLTSGKVYVGIPSEFDPNGDEPDWVRIWPLASGYRTQEGQLVLRTAYGSAYEKLEGAGDDGLKQDHFRILLPVERTLSIQAFSLAFYIQHFAAARGEVQPGLAEALRRELAGRAAPQPIPANIGEDATRRGYPYRGVIPDWFLRTLKWAFHIALTVAIVALPFSLPVVASAIVASIVLLFLLWDPSDEHLRMLGDAVAQGPGVGFLAVPRFEPLVIEIMKQLALQRSKNKGDGKTS